ncbi:MAG: site-specific integrase [Bacteroidota bacterium]
MPNLKVLLYKSKTYKNGTHPVMLRITHNRKAKYFSLNMQCEETDWDFNRCCFTRKFRDYQQKNRMLHFFEEKAYRILDEFIKEDKAFSFLAFEQQFVKKPCSTTVLEFFDELLEDFLTKERIGNYEVYKQVKNALARFAEKKILVFGDIDYRFLKKFETHLFQRGCKGGGVHFYMRTIRAVMNEAIRQGLINRDAYPFSTQFNKAGYSLAHLKSTAQPRPLSASDMEKIKTLDLNAHPHLAKAARYFLFSYYARGINFVDMAKLQWSNIYNGRVEYTRTKTAKKYTIKLSEPLNEILEHFKGTHERYIFPILNDFHKNQIQIKNRVRKCLKQYNGDLKEIAKVLKIDVKLTSYVARHTYATTLKREGVDVSVISEALGHSDIGTTKAYLEHFSSEVLDKADALL